MPLFVSGGLNEIFEELPHVLKGSRNDVEEMLQLFIGYCNVGIGVGGLSSRFCCTLHMRDRGSLRKQLLHHC